VLGQSFSARRGTTRAMEPSQWFSAGWNRAVEQRPLPPFTLTTIHCHAPLADWMGTPVKQHCPYFIFTFAHGAEAIDQITQAIILASLRPAQCLSRFGSSCILSCCDGASRLNHVGEKGVRESKLIVIP
jgi:hypothetical protein